MKHHKLLFLNATLLLTIFFPLNATQANRAEYLEGKKMAMDTNKDKMEMDHEEHEHKTLDVSDNSQIPKIEIKAYKDSVKGWNLEIKTTNFTFTPENIDKGDNGNQGHGHIYINGRKVGRVYGNWYYISGLPEGENEIKVTLNTDSHSDLMYKGEVIGDRIIIENNQP